MRMLGWPGRLLNVLRSWLGSWFHVLLLALAIIGVAVGVVWEQQRHPPVPDTAAQIRSALNVDVRQTTYRYPGSVTKLRAFYRQALPPRGWRYCGTQATPRCTNLIRLVDRPAEAIDVYRRADDLDYRGSTVEIWPVDTQNGHTYVTVFETRSK